MNWRLFRIICAVWCCASLCIIGNDKLNCLDLSINLYRLTPRMRLDHPLVGAYEACMSAYETSRGVRQQGRNTFAVSLKETRALLGLTCRQLGAKIGVTGQLISQIETTAKSILSREQVQMIVDLCKEKHLSAPSKDLRSEAESSNQ